MSANVETMFYVREKPWHGLGTMVQEAPTSAEALKLAGLDWTVEARDMWLNGGYEPIPGYKANVRSSDNKVLGVVSDKYRIVQNADVYNTVDKFWDCYEVLAEDPVDARNVAVQRLIDETGHGLDIYELADVCEVKE